MCLCGCCQVASVVSDSVWPYGQQPTRLLRPWNSPGKNTGVGCRSFSTCASLYPTLWGPIDCSPPGSSVHGIFQARILAWVAIFSSKGSSQLRDQNLVSCIADGFSTPEPLRKPLDISDIFLKWKGLWLASLHTHSLVSFEKVVKMCFGKEENSQTINVVLIHSWYPNPT